MGEGAYSDRLVKAARKELKERLSPGRYAHAESVAKTAAMLARTYGVDVRKAELAGLIHDWDKNYNDTQIRQRAKELGVKVDPEVLEDMPNTLHGATAAVALKRAFPEIGDDVLQAIACHTSGAVGMSDLAMVVYIADVIEPLRPYQSMDALRDSVGKVSLEELFLATFQHVFLHLVENRSRIHPDTVKVWNYYVCRSRKAKAAGKAEARTEAGTGTRTEKGAT